MTASLFLQDHSAGVLRQGIQLTEERFGKKMIQIVTPGMNVDNNAMARAEAEATIAKCAKDGATFCLVHHGSAEQLVNKNTKTIDRLPDYLDMIRQHGNKLPVGGLILFRIQ